MKLPKKGREYCGARTTTLRHCNQWYRHGVHTHCEKCGEVLQFICHRQVPIGMRCDLHLNSPRAADLPKSSSEAVLTVLPAPAREVYLRWDASRAPTQALKDHARVLEAKLAQQELQGAHEQATSTRHMLLNIYAKLVEAGVLGEAANDVHEDFHPENLTVEELGELERLLAKGRARPQVLEAAAEAVEVGAESLPERRG